MPTQLEVVRGVMLLAAQFGSWMTLEELARKTRFPETSISAQLRHLRKEKHGAYQVEKRRREWEEALRTNAKERVWSTKSRDEVGEMKDVKEVKEKDESS